VILFRFSSLDFKRLAGLLPTCVALLGCSLTVDADRQQCSSDLDCTSRGTAFANSTCVASLCKEALVTQKPDSDAGPKAITDPKWSCLDQPAVATTEPGPFNVTFKLTDILSQSPQVGITAKACRKLDVNCEKPDGASLLTDENGEVTFQIARGFTGYMEFSGGTIMPGMYFFNPPVDSDRASVAVQIVTPGIVDALTKSIGSPQQPDLGLMLINAQDCQGAAGVNVTFVAGGTGQGAPGFYSIGGLPASNATATDSAGYGGFVNVTPGTVPIKGIINDIDGIEMQTISLLVRAGTITYGRVVPLGR
jgi:hypothetical protein